MSTTTKATKAAPLEIDGTRERLVRLGLLHAAEALRQELSEAVQHNRSAHRVLDRLLARELDRRDRRRVRTSLRLSGLPPGMTLGEFDFAFQPSVERRQIETLATCAFIYGHIIILVHGPLGVGRPMFVSGSASRRSSRGSRWRSTAWRTCCTRCVSRRLETS